MTKTKAIDLIRMQKTKLDSDNIDYYSWNIQTNAYLSNFFGSNSKQASYFNKYYWNVDSAIMNDIDEEYQKNRARGFLNDCADTIQNLGFYKKANQGNYISRLSDKMITFWLGAIFGGGFLIGRMVFKVFECN